MGSKVGDTAPPALAGKSDNKKGAANKNPQLTPPGGQVEYVFTPTPLLWVLVQVVIYFGTLEINYYVMKIIKRI